MTHEEYTAAMAELKEIWRDEAMVKQAPRYLELVLACEAYEKEHYPIPAPSEQEAQAFRACQEGRCGPDCTYCK